MLRCKVLLAVLTKPLPTCSLEYLHFTCAGMNVFTLQQLVSSAPFMTSFSHPTRLFWLLCLICCFLFPYGTKLSLIVAINPPSLPAEKEFVPRFFIVAVWNEWRQERQGLLECWTQSQRSARCCAPAFLYHRMRGWWGDERLFITPSHSLRLSRRCCPYVLLCSHLSVLVTYTLKRTLFCRFVCKSSLTFLSTPNKNK